jgi:hypothetical protein
LLGALQQEGVQEFSTEAAGQQAHFLGALEESAHGTEASNVINTTSVTTAR